MSNSRGPVVVGMVGNPVIDSEASAITAAVDLAAREAIRRSVELRLVYGQAELPPLPLMCQILAEIIARVSGAFPSLAITTGMLPGTTSVALATASVSASLVVIAAGTGLDDSDTIAGLTTGAMFNAPVVLVMAPTSRSSDLREPALVF